MRKRDILIVLVVSLIIICGFVIPRITPVQAADTDVSRKLDEMLNNQKTILDNIVAIKGELNIIKIRVTQQQ